MKGEKAVNTLKQEFILKDYEQVRTELRNYTNNQFLILSLLLTTSVATYAYNISDIEKLAITTGFIIPALFAVLGILWFDQVYRQKELACYSFLIEAEIYQEINIPIDEITDVQGWEHFTQERHSQRVENGGCGNILRVMRMRANLYYYAAFALGLFAVPIASTVYCFRQLKLLDEYSKLCMLGPYIIACFAIASILYIANILRVQKRINKEREKNERALRRCKEDYIEHVLRK